MRVLGHIHTFNDADVIDRSVRSLLDQTIPVEEIVIVDNGSTDDTLRREFPPKVRTIRHGENLGTSGAVVSGMRYALDRRFDWIWVFDADSAPRPDALERLLEFYRGLSADRQQEIHRLASVYPAPHCGIRFTPEGFDPLRLESGTPPYECDAAIWSGSLFRVAAIQRIGLPSEDYVLDWGEFAYGYDGLRAGYRTYIVPSSVFEHNTGGQATLRLAPVVFGPLTFHVINLPPIRYYYLIRNTIYFWLYEYDKGGLRVCFRQVHPWLSKQLPKLVIAGRWKQTKACIRAVWDGIFKKMQRRY